MDYKPTVINESEFVEVLDSEDGLVQILGATPPPEGSEIEISSVEYEDGDAFFIDIDGAAPYDDAEGLDIPDMNIEETTDNAYDVGDDIDQGDI